MMKIFLPSFCHQFFSLCKYSIYANKSIKFNTTFLNARLTEINKITSLEIDSYMHWLFKQNTKILL